MVRALPMSLPAMRFRTPLCAGFSEICFFTLNIVTLFRCCVLGQGTLPSNASRVSGGNESRENETAGLYALGGVEISHELTGLVNRG